MSRLINVDKLIERMKEDTSRAKEIMPQYNHFNKEVWERVIQVIESYIEIIKEQPTAFNVDKVVKELEWHSKKYEKLAKVTNVEFPQECFRKGISYGYRDAIDVVKAGGIDEKN